MKFKFVSLLLITIVVSCHQNEDYKIKYFSGFNTELKNTGEKVGPINHFLEPRSMVKMDSLIVISDFKTDSVFTIISLSTYNILDYGGLKGRGPGEFNSPDLSKRLFEKKLVITDKFITKTYNLDSLINYQSYIPDKKIVYPPELIIPYNLFYINNNSIIGSTTSGNYRAFLFDIGKGDIVKTVDDIFFEQRSEKNRGHLGQIFYAENDYNFEHECFVSALRMFHRVDLYNSDLSLRFSIINENEFDPVLSNDPNRYLTDATMFHYVDVYTTSKYIFALYCGKDFKSATPGIGNEMHVFSWDGDALAKIFLDIGLSRFIITDKKIVGINWYENQPIVVYNLPDLSG